MADPARGLNDEEEKHRQETLAEEARRHHREMVGNTDLAKRKIELEQQVLEERQANRPTNEENA